MAEAPDPRDATFWANQAALNFARENTLGEDVKGRAKAEADYKYNRGELERAEPLRLKANTNRANTEGLLQSGVLAQRQGQTQTEYAGKQGRLGEARKAAIERFNEGDTKANRTYEIEYNKELAKAGERYKQNLIANPPAEAPAPTYPGQTFPIPPGTYGTPGAGGVTPYESPSGNVRVRGAAPIKWSRNAAVRKIQAERGY